MRIFSAAPCRQLALGVIFLAMPLTPWSLSVQGMHPSKKSTHVTKEKLGDNVKVYEAEISPPLGSLILLMGYWGDHSWTMSGWWYLDPAWYPSNQEWCKDTCVFTDEDKAAVARLRRNLRIVDAVGKIALSETERAWYNYVTWESGVPVAHELEEAVANVFQLIETERAIVGSYDRIAIAGMSQGADLALEVGIRFPQWLGMVIAQRGVIIPSGKHSNQSVAAHVGTPFISTGGDADEIITPSEYTGSCASLQLTQTPVYFKLYHGLNHGDFSKPEWNVLINAFTLMLSPISQRSPYAQPQKAEKMGHITTWNSCDQQHIQAR